MFPNYNFERLVMNALLIFFNFRYPQQIENWPGSAFNFLKASKKTEGSGNKFKIEI